MVNLNFMESIIDKIEFIIDIVLLSFYIIGIILFFFLFLFSIFIFFGNGIFIKKFWIIIRMAVISILFIKLKLEVILNIRFKESISLMFIVMIKIVGKYILFDRLLNIFVLLKYVFILLLIKRLVSI